MTAIPLTILADRMQPLRLAEERVLRDALESGGRVAVIVRDADRPRSVSDPFSLSERIAVLEAAFPGEMGEGKISVIPVDSFGYDDALRLSALANAVELAVGGEPAQLKGFTNEEARATGGEATLKTTDVPGDAATAFSALLAEVRGDAPTSVSLAVAEWIKEFSKTEACRHLEDELAVIFSVRKQYGPGPHLTADAITTYGDSVLLIMRNNPPFKDTLAIPGGILDPGEIPLDAAARELAEETCIASSGESMPEQTVKDAAVFGDPAIYAGEGRDPRGAYVAHAFHFDLSSLPERPEVTPSSDAREADWYRLSDLSPDSLAFDHYAMLHDILGLPYPHSMGDTALPPTRRPR